MNYFRACGRNKVRTTCLPDTRRSFLAATRFLLGIVATTSFLGCNRTPDPVANPSSASVQAEDHSHDHGEGPHDHSVAGHSHGAGPHGGTIADWGGGKYHVEFTVDHDQRQTTVFILGSDEKTAAPINAQTIELSIKDPEMQIVLQASPQTGDQEGTASRFVGTDEKLGIVQEYSGTLTGVIDDVPYSGDFAEESDDAHEH